MSDNFLADKEWNAAERRAKVLAGLPEQLSQADVERAMGQLDVSRATLFRSLKKFRGDGRTSALLPSPRGPKRGMQPLAPDVEAIVSRLLRDFYATRRKPTKTRFAEQMVSGPDETRFYRRILAAIGAPEPPRATLSVLESLALRLFFRAAPRATGDR